MPRCRHCSSFLQTNKEYKKILNRYAYSPDKSGQVVTKVAGCIRFYIPVIILLNPKWISVNSNQDPN